MSRCTLLLLLQLVNNISSVKLPLGYQSKAEDVKSVKGFIPPQEFFNNYVISGTPVVFKSALNKSPAFHKWTDEYFLNHPASAKYMVVYEKGKKETRKNDAGRIPFSEYIRRYINEDLYCVTALPYFLREDLPIYDSINCPFIRDNLFDDLVLWFSSGGTRSVWHHDDYENLNCLIRGKKELILADRADHYLGHFDHQNSSYSSVDVDAVDLEKYPNFAKIKFFNATIEAGDCVFIPSFWQHTVKSFDRNIAVNAWWEIYKTPIECPDNEPTAYFSTSTFRSDPYLGMEGEVEVVDTESKETLHELRTLNWGSSEMRQNNYMNRNTFIDLMSEYLEEEMDIQDYDLEQLFAFLDSNNDGKLQPTELDTLRKEQQQKIATFIPALKSYLPKTEL